MFDKAKWLTRKSGMQVNISWLKSHAGTEGNERADRLANRGKRLADPEGGRQQPFPDHNANAEAAPAHTAHPVTHALLAAAANTLSHHQRIPRTPWMKDTTLQALVQAGTAEAEGTEEARSLCNRAKRMKRPYTLGPQPNSRRPQCDKVAGMAIRSQGFQGKRSHLWEDNQPQIPQPWSCLQDEGDFTAQELQAATRNLKPNEAPGPDELPADVLKLLDAEGEEIMLDMFNRTAGLGGSP